MAEEVIPSEVAIPPEVGFPTEVAMDEEVPTEGPEAHLQMADLCAGVRCEGREDHHRRPSATLKALVV